MRRNRKRKGDSMVQRFAQWSRTAMGKYAHKLRRVAILALALGVTGLVYASFSPTSSVADEEAKKDDPAYIKEGQTLFEEGCISCHGLNAEGVEGRGPSLVGVGAAAVEYQVSTGKMPMAAQNAQAPGKPSSYTPEEIAQLAAFIQSLGGGPEVPDEYLRYKDEIAYGGQLFRANCSSCHGASAQGGALSSGKKAPTLSDLTDRQIYAAMVSGPENMPVFADSQITPEEKKAIIAYVQSMKEDKDPGGNGIGRTGPVPEGLVVFVVGVAALLVGALWIAGKS